MGQTYAMFHQRLREYQNWQYLQKKSFKKARIIKRLKLGSNGTKYYQKLHTSIKNSTEQNGVKLKLYSSKENSSERERAQKNQDLARGQ